MTDHLHNEKEPPIKELNDFTLEDNPGFTDRVNRSLNRHLLAGDSLEFSLEIFQKTMWEYLKTMVEHLPSNKKDNLEND